MLPRRLVENICQNEINRQHTIYKIQGRYKKTTHYVMLTKQPATQYRIHSLVKIKDRKIDIQWSFLSNNVTVVSARCIMVLTESTRMAHIVSKIPSTKIMLRSFGKQAMFLAKQPDISLVNFQVN